MSESVEDEVVRMRFDNNAFERGVSTTLSTLGKLKQSLSFGNAGKGLDDLDKSANKFNMKNVNDQIDSSAHHWSAWRTAGLIAFATVVHRAVNAGINIVKSFTVSPIAEGMKSYNEQINATQTILANTKAAGVTLPQVTATLAELQKYANMTVYSFSDMTTNIAKFTAAGVPLKSATASIKGMANVAALSGANTQQMSSAMYQMSQALSTGTIKLQDWNSLSNANMAGTNIQKALEATARTMGDNGKAMDAAIKKGGNFRNSLQSGWLTAGIFNKTMGVMAGTLDKSTGKMRAFSVEELKSQGYSEAQAKSLNQLSQSALNSAIQIRTLPQMMQALKEEVATAYGAVFKTIFGDINQATSLFTAMHNTLENALTGPIYALNNLLEGTAKLGGRAKIIQALTTVFHALSLVLHAVENAFHSVFPSETPKGLLHMIDAFQHFSALLSNFVQVNRGAIENTFKGLFAILDIGKQVVMGVVHVFAQLLGALTGGGGPNAFLKFTGSIGLMIFNFDQALKKGNVLANFFKIIGNVLSIPLHFVTMFATAIGSLFSGFRSKDANGLDSSVQKTGDLLARVANLTQHVSNWFAGLGKYIQPGVHAVVSGVQKIGSALASGLGSNSFSNILKAIQVGLLGGITLLLKNFLKGGLSVDIGKGGIAKIGEAFEALTNKTKAMTQNVKADTLMKIAIAIGVLTASVVALSLVNTDKMKTALTAMAVGFGELLGAMAVLTKISGAAGIVKIPVMAASLDLLAGAILILTTAVIALSLLSWQQLEKGLTAVGILLGALSISAVILSKNAGGMLLAGAGIAAMAVGINLLAIAVKVFATMSWGDMLKGLSGIGIALVGIAIAMRLMPKGMLFQSASILLIATALNALYLAVHNFSGLSWGEMVKGLTGIAGGLVAIMIGMKFMPPGMVLQAVALNLIALALLNIDKAVANMAMLSWSAMVKGLVGLAGALLVLAGGLTLMSGTLAGAAALLVVSAALHVFVPSLIALSQMSWGAIFKGLVALAAAFGVIGLSALILAPVIPMMIALGVALGIVGVAILAFGAGAALLGIGLTAIAASGGAAIGVLLGGLRSLIDMLPALGTNLATALVSFITIIGSHAPQIIAAFVNILNGLLQAVPKIMPSLIIAFGSIIQGLLTVLTQNAPRIIAAGFQLLMDLLNGIKNNIGQVVTTVVSIVVNFLNALASNVGRIIQAGVNLLFQFLEGVARAAGAIPAEVVKIIGIFVGSLLSHEGQLFSAGIQLLNRLSGGLLNNIGSMALAGIRIAGRFLSGIAGQLGNIAAGGARMLSHLLSGIFGNIGSAFADLGQAGWNLAKHLVDGLMNGIKSMAKNAIDAAKNLASDAVSAVGDFLGIGGPSQVFHDIGEKGIGGGLINGLNAVHKKVNDAAANVGQQGVLAMQKTFAGLSQAISDSNLDYNPTIAPVLDLSQFSRDAAGMSSLMAVSPVDASLSYNQAANISAAQQAAQEAAATTPAAGSASTNVSLTQNNYSPKALSVVDIYRQTNNQISKAAALVGIPKTD